MTGVAQPVLESVLRPPLQRSGSNDNPEEFAEVGGRLVFTARSIAEGTELWAIDPQTRGVSLVADIATGTDSSFPRSLAKAGSRLWFVANDSQGESLWATDGTAAGTVRIAALPKAVGSIGKPVALDGDRVVIAVRELVKGSMITSLWVTDGTTPGTRKLTPSDTVDVSFDKPTPRGGTVYFSARSKFSNAGGGLWRGELWKTDGTPERTLAVAVPSVAGSAPVSATPPSQLTAADDGVYFVSAGPAIPFGGTGWQGGPIDVWCYREPDGTLVRVTNSMSDSRFHGFFHSLTPWKGRLFFAAQSETVGLPWQLFVSEGPSGGVTLLTSAPTYPSSVTAGSDGVFFRVGTYDLSKGNLWRSDGTNGGTSRVAGSRWPTTSIALVNGAVFTDSARRLARMAQDTSTLVELSQATVRFKPWSPISALGKSVYFWASGNSGFGIDTLYRYDLPVSLPGSPSAVRVVGDDGKVEIAWDAPLEDGGSPVIDYVVEYSSDDGATWTTSTDDVSSATTATITGLSNGRSYICRVSATNSAGRGPASAVSGPVTPVARSSNRPPADIFLSASRIAENQAPPALVGRFSTIDQDVGDTFTYTLVGGTGDTDNELFTIVGNELRTAASLDYESRVGSGDCSILVRSTDQGGLWTEKAFAVSVIDANEAPGVPTNLMATTRNAEVLLSWTAPDFDGGAPISDWVIQRQTVGSSMWTTVMDGRSPSRSAVVAGLTQGAGYVFRVAAVNSTGQGLFSTPSTVVILATAPGAPLGLTGTPGNRVARLTWSAPAFDGGRPIASYIIEYSTNSGRSWRRFGTSTATLATVTGLTNGVLHMFRVLAVNGVGSGARSRVVTVRPRG